MIAEAAADGLTTVDEACAQLRLFPAFRTDPQWSASEPGGLLGVRAHERLPRRSVRACKLRRAPARARPPAAQASRARTAPHHTGGSAADPQAPLRMPPGAAGRGGQRGRRPGGRRRSSLGLRRRQGGEGAGAVAAREAALDALLRAAVPHLVLAPRQHYGIEDAAAQAVPPATPRVEASSGDQLSVAVPSHDEAAHDEAAHDGAGAEGDAGTHGASGALEAVPRAWTPPSPPSRELLHSPPDWVRPPPSLGALRSPSL